MPIVNTPSSCFAPSLRHRRLLHQYVIVVKLHQYVIVVKLHQYVIVVKLPPSIRHNRSYRGVCCLDAQVSVWDAAINKSTTRCDGGAAGTCQMEPNLT
jgi:hypothetical protein